MTTFVSPLSVVVSTVVSTVTATPLLSNILVATSATAFQHLSKSKSSYKYNNLNNKMPSSAFNSLLRSTNNDDDVGGGGGMINIDDINRQSIVDVHRIRGGGGGDDGNSSSTESNKSILQKPPPRAMSCIYMAIAMAFHFGGYEFARSGALALFTSSKTGFSHPAAYPFAIGLVTPASFTLLYWYGLLLKAKGPRFALKTTSALSVSILTIGCITLGTLFKMNTGTTSGIIGIASRIVVGCLFVFQNSYAHLLYTQQWSFLGSVMTPSEGTKYFSAIAGLSSLICTGAATIVHTLASTVGLLGLIAGTCITLTLSLLCADHAYALSEIVSSVLL